MSVLPNDRYEKITAVAGQTVFNYDWDVPSAYPGQVKVIWYVLATQTKTLLTYGVDYTVDVANKRVTLTNATAAGDTIVLYSGTPEARETDFTGSTVNVAAANEAIDNLTWQTQQLARDVKRCVRVDMVEGIMAGELPSVNARRNKYASWDNDGNLTYDDPVTGILNDYMRKDANLSDVNDVATSRANLGLGDSATRNVGTTAGTVCAGDDTRFLTQAQKDALTNGGNADAMHIHNGYVATAEKGAPNGVATLDANSKLPVAQLPSNVVVSTTTSSDSEIALFNGVSGTQIKRSNKLLPAGDIVGTTDAQTLTNKTIDADNNTVTNLEVDNLKAGVLSTDLSGATSDTEIPSSKATKDYADTKCATVHNLGTGVQIAHEGLNGGTAEIRSLIAKDGIQLVQNENDIYLYGVPSETTFPIFDKQGNGADWYKQTIGNHIEYRSFTGSNGVTVAQNGDEIDTSLTNITAQGDMIVGDAGGEASTLAKGADDQIMRMYGNNPNWETPGTMIDQNSDNVNITGGAIDGVAISNGTVTDATITGGTVSGLTAPIAIADGGTGQITKTAAFDALSPLTTQGDILIHDGTNNVRLARGTAGKGLVVNAAGTDPVWGVVDTLDGNITGQVASGDDLNNYTTFGVYMITNVNTITNAPAGMSYGGKLTVSNGNGGSVLQKIEGNYGNEQWARCGYQGAWYAWKRMTSPLTTRGDLYVRGATHDERLAIGTPGQVIQVNSGGTDPEWATLGSMSTQASDAVAITGGTMADVAITGGTISGLTTPLAVASGGTGVNAFGTASQSLLVNKTADALAWHEVDCLDIANLKDGLADNTNLNDITNPGTYWMQNGATAVNRPATMTSNSIRITVKQINTNNIIQTVETAISNQHFVRTFQIDSATWSAWKSDSEWFNLTYVSTNGSTGTNFSLPAGVETAIPWLDIYPTSNDLATLTWAATGSKITIKSAGTYMLFYNIALTSADGTNNVQFRTTGINSHYLYSCQTKPMSSSFLNYFTGFTRWYLSVGSEFFFYIKPSLETTMYGGSTVYSELYFLKIG